MNDLIGDEFKMYYHNGTPSSQNGSWFLTLLGLLFIGLKLTGYISWSWWWVTLPLWGPWALVAIWVVIYLILDFICRRS